MITIFANDGQLVETDFDDINSAIAYINSNLKSFEYGNKLVIVDFENEITRFVEFKLKMVIK